MSPWSARPARPPRQQGPRGGVSLPRELIEAARSQPYASSSHDRRGQEQSTAGSPTGTPTRPAGTSRAAEDVHGRGRGLLGGRHRRRHGDPPHRHLLRRPGHLGHLQEGNGSGVSIAGNGTLAGAAAGDCGMDIDLDGRVDGLTWASATTGARSPRSSTTTPRTSSASSPSCAGRAARGGLRPPEHDPPQPGGDRGAGGDRHRPRPAAPVIELTTTTLNFTATTNRAAKRSGGTRRPAPGGVGHRGHRHEVDLGWNLGAVGATRPGASEVVDGEYPVSAKAYDSSATTGPVPRQRQGQPPRALPAPAFQTVRVGAVVEIEWTKPPARHPATRSSASPPRRRPWSAVHATSSRATPRPPPARAPTRTSPAPSTRTLAGNLRTGDCHVAQRRHPLRQPVAAGSGERHRPACERPGEPELVHGTGHSEADPDAGDSVTGAT